MMREEAIEWFETHMPTKITPVAKQSYLIAIAALRPVSREQVEKVWRAKDDSPHGNGRWFHCTSCDYGCDDYYSYDESQIPDNRFRFCPCCGKAMTNEAVEMVMKRMEALHDD